MPLGHPEPFVEPTRRRIRVRLGGHLVADSTRAQLLVQYGPSGPPSYLLPLADVRPGALVEETGGTFTVQAGDADASTCLRGGDTAGVLRTSM